MASTAHEEQSSSSYGGMKAELPGSSQQGHGQGYMAEKKMAGVEHSGPAAELEPGRDGLNEMDGRERRPVELPGSEAFEERRGTGTQDVKSPVEAGV